MDVTLINPLFDSDWDTQVLSHPDFRFFHSSAWAKVLSATYGHEPHYLRCSQRGSLLALIPIMEVCSPVTGRRGICLPFTDGCAPLLFNGCDSRLVIDKLIEVARKRRWKYLEIRGGTPPEVSAHPSVSYYGHSLDLRSGVEALLNGCEGSVRRAIRKAERSNLKVEVCRTRESVLEYYRLHVLTRKRHGLPPQPLSFFLNIYESVIKNGLGSVVLARRESQLHSAAVFFHWGKTAVYKFGASDETFQEFRGNNLVVWEGIRFLVESGVESLHFGRTSLDQEGLRRFKLAWGTQEELIEYFKFNAVSNTWVTGRDNASGFHNVAFGRFPLAVNRLAGALIYPHLD